MQIIKICLYITLSILVIWYIYILSSNTKRTAHPFGKKKAILTIIKKYPNITPRTTRQLENAVQEMGIYFYESGEINYEALLDSLAHVKSNQNGINDKIVQEIDVISEYIRKSNPFLHISNGSGALFKKLNDDVNKKDFLEASKDVTLLYEKTKEVEALLKKRNRRDFWVGTVIGIVGIAISIVTGFMS